MPLTTTEKIELMRAMGWKGTGAEWCWWTTPDGTKRRNWIDPEERAADAMAVLTWIMETVTPQDKAIAIGHGGTVWVSVYDAESEMEECCSGNTISDPAQALRSAIAACGLEVARRMAQGGAVEAIKDRKE